MDEFVTLENLLEGGLSEMFDHELKRVNDNIRDPNTPATAERSVTLTIKLKPDERREQCATKVTCAAKLANAEPVETTIFIGTLDGEPVAYEHNPRQMRMKFDREPAETTKA
jgi:hypothetical protein